MLMAKHYVQVGWNDVPHLDEDAQADLLKGRPQHERDARMRGIPALGSGRVFPINEEELVVKPFQIPAYWAQIGGLDFGWDHPAAGVRIAHNRDNDRVYVIDAYRASNVTPFQQAETLKAWGRFPWAWPHDGLQHDKGSGNQLAENYRSHGLRLLEKHAQWADGSIGVEAGIMMMIDRMQTGRLLVFETLNDWLQEFRIYHRKDGIIVKLNDDLMSATRYALMMIQFAEIPAMRRAARKSEVFVY